jgi:hypothetical protein
MKTRISDELIRPDLSAEIASAITTAIDHYKWTRWWFNETYGLTSSTADGTRFYPPPSSFLSLDSLRIRTSGSSMYQLQAMSFDDMEKLTEIDGENKSQPYFFSEYQDQIALYPVPNGVYTLYWSGLLDRAPSSDGETSNPWMTHGEALIRQRAKAIVKLDIIENEAARQEAQALALNGKSSLSILEEQAYVMLRRQTVKETTSGRIRRSRY